MIDDFNQIDNKCTKRNFMWGKYKWETESSAVQSGQGFKAILNNHYYCKYIMMFMTLSLLQLLTTRTTLFCFWSLITVYVYNESYNDSQVKCDLFSKIRKMRQNLTQNWLIYIVIMMENIYLLKRKNIVLRRESFII